MGNKSSKAACNDGKCGKPDCQRCGKTRYPLHFLLLGGTGAGKSSTGNSILGKKSFKPSNATKPKTIKVKNAYADHGCYDTKVVDTPGFIQFEGTDTLDDIVKKMAKALLLCDGGVHVFLLVLKIGERFTPAFIKTISDLKEIFGENYLKERGIIVVTGGDNLAATVENGGTLDRAFNNWVSSGDHCKEFEALVKECGSRIVLFNNFIKDEDEQEAQRYRLFDKAEELRQKGLYTSEYFEKYGEIRKKLTIEINFPLLKEDFQRKINLLAEKLADLPQSPTLEDVDRVETEIVDLLSDITNSESNEQLKPLDDALLETLEIAEKLKCAVQDNDTQGIEWHTKAIQSLRKTLHKAGKIPWKKILIYILAGIAIGAVAAGAIAAVVVTRGAVLPALMKVVPRVAPVLFAIGSSYLQNSYTD